MNPIITGDVCLLKSEVNLLKVRKDLTIKWYDKATEEHHSVSAFRMEGKYIHVPRYYGAHLLDHGLKLTDESSDGFPIEGWNPLTFRPNQKPFVTQLEDVFSTDVAHDCRAEAHTGFGKTVCSLEYIRRRGRTTLIVVDQEFLRDQWISEAKEIFGVDEDRIGIIQGKVCDYKDKDIVIGMIQTLYNKQYDDDMYSYFGTVVYDECHTVGAEQFSKVLMQFSAKVRFGVSATPDRTDALQKLLELNLGEVEVVIAAKHKKSMVRYVEYDGVISWYANISPKNGRYISEIACDDRRNSLLVWIILNLYGKGRTVLGVSDRAMHIHNIKYMLMDKGVPEEDIGIVTTYYHTWKYKKDPTPPRKPEGLGKGEDGKALEYTPVCIQLHKKKIPRDVLDYNKENKRIVLTTYSMFTKGVNVPHLDSGIDLTPRSKAKQLHGRILRMIAGKLIPIWVTVRDKMSYKAEFQFANRIKEYEQSNAEMYKWNPRKGVRKVDTRQLKSEVFKRGAMLKKSEVITNQDGENIVMIQSSGTQ